MTVIESSSYGRYVKLVLEVNEIATSIEANTSTLSWSLKLMPDTSYAWDFNNESLAEVEIAGQTVHSAYHSFDTRNGAIAYLANGTTTVPHDEDGNKSIQIWARMTHVSDFGDINWFSGTMTLTSIPRASQISDTALEGNRQLGSEHTLTITKKADKFTHQVWYRVFGSDWIDLGKNHGHIVKFTPPLTLAQHSPNSSEGKLDICVRTYDGNTQIGNDVYSNGWYFSVPGSVQPTIGNFIASERSTKVAQILGSGHYLQDASTINLAIVNAQGAYGSQIVNAEIMLDGEKQSGITATFHAKKAGRLVATAKVTDSRGRTATRSLSINVISYSSPKIIAFLPARTGNSTNKGVSAQVITNVKAVSLNGQNKNKYTLKIEYSERNANRWTKVHETVETTEQITRNISCGEFYDLTKSYDIRLTISDQFSNSISATQTISTSSVLMSWGVDNIGIGKVPEKARTFEIALTTDFQSSVHSKGKPIQLHALTNEDGTLTGTRTLTNTTSAIESGWYWCTPRTYSLPFQNEGGWLECIKIDENEGFYRFISTTGKMAIRRRVGRTSFLAWQTIGVAEPTWHTASLTSGWQHDYKFGVQYSKSADGTVFMRGTAKGGRIIGETIIFNLPIGYRPTKDTYKMTINNDYGLAILCIYPNGNIVVKSNVDDTWLNFDNISFRI